MSDSLSPVSLADIMASPDPATAKAAKLALEKLAHAAGAPRAGAVQRRETLQALREIALSKRPRLVRAHALRLLGLIGARPEAQALAPVERDPEVGEDARMARERIRRR
jgi:hypothetical protein